LLHVSSQTENYVEDEPYQVLLSFLTLPLSTRGVVSFLIGTAVAVLMLVIAWRVLR
jgi:hypothetical protein